MSKPITPDEVAEEKKAGLPPGVLEAWNATIAKHHSNGRSHFTQNEIVDAIVARTDYSSQQIFAGRMLDVEIIFREAGWKVVYDKPGYCESYEATFTFTRREIRY